MQKIIFRNLAPFIWTSAHQAATYATVTLDLSLWKDDIDSKKISLLELVILALKKGHESEPRVSSYVSFRRIRQKTNFSVSIMTPHLGEDLSFVTLKDLQKKNDQEIVSELRGSLQNVKTKGRSEQFVKTYKLVGYIPRWMLFFIMPLIKFLVHRIKLPFIPHKPFGDIVISNVGALGFDSALLPLTPLARASVMVAIGRMNQGQVQLGFTMDHRLMDGYHAHKFMLGFNSVIQRK